MRGDLCAFAARLERWLRSGVMASIVAITATETAVCPTPGASGLGGPFPMCDEGVPGRPSSGYDWGELGSEGGVWSRSQYGSFLSYGSRAPFPT